MPELFKEGDLVWLWYKAKALEKDPSLPRGQLIGDRMYIKGTINRVVSENRAVYKTKAASRYIRYEIEVKGSDSCWYRFNTELQHRLSLKNIWKGWIQ